MAHFAKIDENNTVTQVLVVPDEQEHRGQEYLADDLMLGGRWIQTSYNTVAGVHYGPDWVPDGKPGLRKNYAGIGYYYDEQRDAFIPPAPIDYTFVLDEDKCIWVPPSSYPSDGDAYVWDVTLHQWIRVPRPE
jgi:hypothetical protein